MFLEDFVSLDLSAGQFPDLEIQNPHPTLKETDKKEYRVCFSGWIGIWNNIRIGEFYSEFCNWYLNKVGFGEFHSEFMNFFLVEIGIWKSIPLAEPRIEFCRLLKPRMRSRRSKLRKKKPKISGNFLVCFFCRSQRSCWNMLNSLKSYFQSIFLYLCKVSITCKTGVTEPKVQGQEEKTVFFTRWFIMNHDWFGSLIVADKCCRCFISLAFPPDPMAPPSFLSFLTQAEEKPTRSPEDHEIFRLRNEVFGWKQTVSGILAKHFAWQFCWWPFCDG